MATEDSIKLIEGVMGAFNAREWDKYLACFAEAAVTYEPDESDPIKGRQGLKRRIDAYLTAFPDVQLEKERLFGEVWVCLNSLFNGTHSGNLAGPGGVTINPTGRKVSVHGCSVFRIANGLITKFVGYYDQVELLSQLGFGVRLAPV